MSNNKDNRNEKLSDAKATADLLLKKHQRNKKTIETVNKRTAKDYILWLVFLLAIISAGLVNSYLPGYWAPANDIWTKIAIISALVVFSLICLSLTTHASDFKILVKEAGVELKRVTWPTKKETINWTWLSILAMSIFALLVWVLDMFSTQVVGFIIGG